MSQNHSRSEKTERYLRKPGRSGSFGPNRGFSGGGEGGGRGVIAPSPAFPSHAAPRPSWASREISTNRSLNNSVSEQGGQVRVNLSNSNSDTAQLPAPNGACNTFISHGPSNGLASKGAQPDSLNDKKICRAVPKAPAAQFAAIRPGAESAPFLQFGTINPGIVKGMQVPARTCSAPPNLDEQKSDQVCHDSLRVGHALPTPSASKPLQLQPLPQQKQQSRKVGVSQADIRESHPPAHANRGLTNVPTLAVPGTTPARSSVLPVGGIPMHIPFQQQQIPVQFSSPNMQMSSHSTLPTSFQMPMALSAGNVPQPMFIPSIQSHLMQPQAIMHQGQNLGFAPQLGHQFPQLTSMGIGVAPQFSQQHHGTFVSQRKAVKITHPETHEELLIYSKGSVSLADSGTSGQRQLPNTTSQFSSLPLLNHQISYYPTTYNHSQLFFPSSSLPLTGSQMTTGPQTALHSYPVGQNGQPISFTDSSPFDPAIGGRPGSQPSSHGLLAVNSEGSSYSVLLGPLAQSTAKPASLLLSEKAGTSTVRISMPVTKPELSKPTKLPADLPFASQHQENEVGYQSNVLTHKQNIESANADSFLSENDKNLGTLSEPSSVIHTCISDASSSVVAENDSREVEVLIIPESVHDLQKRLSKVEIKHSQQQTDTIRTLVSNDSTSKGETPTTNSLSSATSSPSIDREFKNSDLDKKKDTGGGSHSLSSTLEKEPSQGASSSVSELVEAAGGTLLFVETIHSEASTSPITVVDGILRTSDSSTNKYKTLEVGDNQEIHSGSECLRDEVCDDDLLSSSSPAFTSIGFLDVTIRKENQEAVAEYSEKRQSFELCRSDNSHFAINEEGGSYIPVNIETMTVSNMPVTTFSDSKEAEPLSYDGIPFNNLNEGNISDPIVKKSEILDSEDVTANGPCILLSEMLAMPSVSLEIKEKPEIKSVELFNGAQTPSVLSGPAERAFLEPNRTRNNKKKRKEIYSKADATGSSDLYNAYKHPEEKLEAACTLQTSESSSTTKSNNDSVEDLNSVVMTVEQDEQSKAELEDWEDAADTSTPKLRTLDNGELDHVEKKIYDECGGETIGKRTYSRDFLLTFSGHCKDLPNGFEIGSDLTNIMSHSLGLKRGTGNDTIANSGRIIDRSSGPSRGDRRMAAISDDDRWIKSNAFRTVHSHEIAAAKFLPAQGVNTGVLRNPSMHSTNQFSGGILSGPLQSFPSQGGVARNNSDLDWWQRATVTQRGLMPSPQGPMQVMHKSANRYEIGKVSDEEEQKQRRLKAILNKLTPQNFEKLFAQVKEVNIDNTITLTGVISQIFDKALMEPTFCEMYADFCFHLASELPDFFEENEKITFRRLLLNKCQEEFERGEREQAEADKADEEGEIHQTEDEREEKRIRVRRCMLGNIRLIGELFKKKMLTERIMHECMKKLLGQYQNPDEENIEALCKLMSTIGEMIDHLKGREHMDAYFDVMLKHSTNQKLSSRVRFMLKDTIDLRKNRWRQRRKIEGPKKIEDVHRDAAQERQAQTSKLGRGSVISSRRGPSVDYGHRGSTILISNNSQLSGSIRGLPGHARGSGNQDVRLDERHQLESKVLSIPLSHRPTSDGSVTLGPQGGLTKGMTGRGQGLISNNPLTEISPRIDNTHRSISGSNDFSSVSTSDHINFISREESMSKYGTCGPSVETNDQIHLQDRNSVVGMRGSHFAGRADRSSITTSGRRPASSGGKINASSEPKALSEDMLRDKSISAIREFYSAKDEKEIALCIRDLNAPSFYPSMVSLWVTDSFEREIFERSLLAQLLVNLTKGQDNLIAQSQLIEGFESVLFSLEDAVNDAPKAAEFLGHIFGRVVVENAVQLMEIGKLILKGGEVPGNLVKLGLGSEIFGNILEFVQMVKGDSFLNDIRISSNLRLDDFKPPNPSSKSKKLNAFL